MNNHLPPAPAVDRRIQKTKKGLSLALIALILEKGYEHISVQDIIDRANVGRSTFYSHYESKEQLLLDGHRNLGIVFFNAGAPLDFEPLFLHAGENVDLAKSMFGKKSGGIILGHFKNHLAENIRQQFKRHFGKSRNEKLMLNYTSEAAAAIVISFLVSWLEDDMPIPANEIAARCQQLVVAMVPGI